MSQSSTFSRGAAKWLFILGGWMLGALFITGHQAIQIYFSGRNPANVGPLLILHVVSTSSWFALTPLILWVSKRFALDKGRLYKQLPAQLICGLLIILLQMGFDALIVPSLGVRANRPSTFLEAYAFLFLTNFPWNVSIYCSVLGIVFGVRYYRKFTERELRASQLEARLARAQLHALKMQLHPHFLFNTHNAISELIHKDPKSAEQMLSNLSGLLRFSLDNLETEEVPLQQELDFVVKYLEIQQVRFQDRLRVKINVAPEALEALVPNMILQPLVENAINHGIAPLLRGGTVEVRAASEGGRLHLQVLDDGVGIGGAGGVAYGVGLSNTRARLEHLYGDFSFEIRPGPGRGTNVSLRVPFKGAASPAGAPGAGAVDEA